MARASSERLSLNPENIMTIFTRFHRSNRVLFITAIICLITAVTTSALVAASGGENETREDHLIAYPAQADASAKAKMAENFGRLPLSFEVNEGQVDQSVKFLARGPGYDLFLTAAEAVLSVRKPRTFDRDPRQAPAKASATVIEGAVIRLRMIGSNPSAKAEGQDELSGKVNYFTGNDPEQWLRNVRTYGRVHYKEIFRGIDMVYYGRQRELEYDFIIAPGADPKAIRFRVEGAEQLRLDDEGSLLLRVKHGEVRLNKPLIYQSGEQGGRTEVKGAYVIKGNEITFKVRGYDSTKPLVIDPVLSYSTFLGTSANYQASAIAIDSQGSAYVTGVTS